MGSLCDAYGYHWDKEVLDAMKEELFLSIMGGGLLKPRRPAGAQAAVAAAAP